LTEDKKILHISTIDVGGSYNAAKRLNEMLTEHGIESKVLVRTKTKADSDVVEAFDNGWDRFGSKSKNLINLMFKKGEVKRDVLGTDLTKNPLVQGADIIFLHWVSTFLSPKQIYEISKLEGKRVIFDMHDMWLFTGGCHVDRRCGRYANECKDCPMAGNSAHISFERKKKWITKADLEIVGPSNWIVEEAKKSSITNGKNISVLPNVYDAKTFHTVDSDEKNTIRKKLGIDQDKKVVLFGAADTGTKNSNKGFDYLLNALKALDMSDKQLVVIGNADAGAKEVLKAYDVLYKGFIADESALADIYRSADVFVNPSLQESFGYTVCESMACGTPAVAFAVGGMLDQISHRENGYLAKFCDSDDLAKGLGFVLENSSDLGRRAAVAAHRYSYDEAYEKVKAML